MTGVNSILYNGKNYTYKHTWYIPGIGNPNRNCAAKKSLWGSTVWVKVSLGSLWKINQYSVNHSLYTLFNTEYLRLTNTILTVKHKFSIYTDFVLCCLLWDCNSCASPFNFSCPLSLRGAAQNTFIFEHHFNYRSATFLDIMMSKKKEWLHIL